MKHSHTKIWIHLIWATKNRERVLFKDTAIELFNFITKKATEINVPLESLNIQPEHIHALVNLPTNICLSDFVKNIKGASSHWLNSEQIAKSKFTWQRGFGGYSVSASQLDVVKKYIKNQSEHHKKNTFKEEYEQWKKEYGILDD